MEPFYAFSGKRPTGSPGFMNHDPGCLAEGENGVAPAAGMPVQKNRNLIIAAYSRSQARTWSGPGMPPAWTTLPSSTTPGVDMTP